MTQCIIKPDNDISINDILMARDNDQSINGVSQWRIINVLAIMVSCWRMVYDNDRRNRQPTNETGMTMLLSK